MKVVEFYTGSMGVQIGYKGLYWLTSLNTLNKEAAKLQTEVRRICKAVGIHNEYSDYSVDIDFSTSTMFISVPNCSNCKKCIEVSKEAEKRHFKWTIGKEAAELLN